MFLLLFFHDDGVHPAARRSQSALWYDVIRAKGGIIDENNKKGDCPKALNPTGESLIFVRPN